MDRDVAPYLLQGVLDAGRSFLHTRAARMSAWWWGIAIGPGCRCYGLPIFERLPGARVQIGARCQFRSAPWSDAGGISRPCIVSASTPIAEIEIGSDCIFQGTAIRCSTRISIGDRVTCAANVTITDADGHPVGWRARKTNSWGAMAPVLIGDDAWLGMNVVVLKGVEIGKRTLVAPGSLVTRSLPPDVIAGGRPAVALRQRGGDEHWAMMRLGCSGVAGAEPKPDADAVLPPARRTQ